MQFNTYKSNYQKQIKTLIIDINHIKILNLKVCCIYIIGYWVGVKNALTHF